MLFVHMHDTGNPSPTETKKDPPPRHLDFLHHSPSFFLLLEDTWCDQRQIDTVLKDVTSDTVRKHSALSGAAEPFKKVGELCLDP